VNPSFSPLVQRRRFRAELRQARQKADLTQDAVADKMDWSLSKVIRIESGTVGISTNDLQALLRIFGIKDAAKVRELVALGREARRPTWWSKYRQSMPPAYFQYIEYETAASVIRSYETMMVPGLLQTQQYATTMALRSRTVLSAKTVQTLIEIRMKRQDLLLHQEESPKIYFVVDETAIRRLSAEREIAPGQITRLLEMARRPQITIEVIPFRAGLVRGINENFSLLEFDEPNDHDILYFESARDQLSGHDDSSGIDEAMTYRELFEGLRAASLGPEGTYRFLEGVASEAI
jgi:transcriptional regulator with XRE-family HTH domain